MASLQSPTNKAVTDLGKRLLEASRLGDSEEVGHLMANGAPLTTDWLGTTPLHLAAIYGHTATAEVLVQSGMSRDAKTKVDKTPLHFACQHGHFEIAKLLVSGGAQINAVDMLGMTPLHWAVEANSLNIVLLLLKSGAKSSIKNKFNKTPLTIAEEKGYNPILNVLNDEEFKSLRQSDSVQEVSPKERDNARLKPLKIVDTNADSRKRQKLRKFPMIAGTWTDRKDKRKDKVPEGLTAYRPVKSAIESRLILPEPHTCAEITSEDLTKSSLTSLVSAVTSKSSVCAKTAPRSGDANGTQAVRFSLPSAADYQFAAVAPTPLSLIPQAFSGLRGAFIATPTGMMPHLASVNGSPGLVGAVPVSAFGQSPQLLLSNGHVLHRDLFQTSSLLNWMPVMPPLNLIPPNLLGTGILQAIPLHVQSPVMSMSVGNHHGAQTNLATTSAAHLSSDVSPPLSFPTTCLSIVGSIPKSTSSLTTFSSPAASLSSSMVASERSTADSARTSAMEEMLRAKRQVEDHVKEHIGVSGLASFQPPAEERRGDVLDSCRPVVSDDSRISLPASLLHKIVGGDITVHAVAVKSVQNSSLCPGALQAIAGITTEMGTIPLIPVSEGGGLQLIPIGDASCLRAQPTGTLSPLQLPLFRVPAVVSSSSALSTCMISSGVASTTVGSNPPPHLAANSLSMMAAHFGGFSVPRQALINGTSVYASQLLSSFEKAGKEDATLFGPDTAAAQLMRIHQTLLKNKTGQAETDDVDLTVTVISSSKSGQSDASPSTSTVSTPSIDAAFLPDELRFDNADDDTLEFMRYFEQAEAVIEEMEQAEERSSLQSNLRDSEQAKARDEKEKVAVQTSLLELSS